MKKTETPPTHVAFLGHRRLAHGTLTAVLAKAKDAFDRARDGPLLVFEDATGKQVEFDLSGTLDDVLDRARPRPRPGRPSLGVVAREVTLLPRHWEWLESQAGGASATLRRLVEAARSRDPEGQKARASRDATGTFLWAIAGDLPGFEEASRALYAGETSRFLALAKRWPKDVRAHARYLLTGV